MKHIASRDNAHFTALKKLCQSGRERRKTGHILLDGMHLVDCYVRRLGKHEELVVSESGATHREIAEFLAGGRGGSSVSVLSDALFSELATVETPSGIMAVVVQPRCAHGLDQERDAVVLDGV